MSIAYCGPLKIQGESHFGKVRIGQTKMVKVKVSNPTKRTLYLGNLQLYGTTAFSYKKGSCILNGQSLRPRRGCNFYIEYAPEEETLNFSEFSIGYYNNRGTKWYESSHKLMGIVFWE